MFWWCKASTTNQVRVQSGRGTLPISLCMASMPAHVECKPWAGIFDSLTWAPAHFLALEMVPFFPDKKALHPCTLTVYNIPKFNLFYEFLLVDLWASVTRDLFRFVLWGWQIVVMLVHGQLGWQLTIGIGRLMCIIGRHLLLKMLQKLKHPPRSKLQMECLLVGHGCPGYTSVKGLVTVLRSQCCEVMDAQVSKLPLGLDIVFSQLQTCLQMSMTWRLQWHKYEFDYIRGV